MDASSKPAISRELFSALTCRFFCSYVDTSTAQRLNLTYGNGDTFILRADSDTMLPADGPGRNSVRLTSKNTYSNSVIAMDIRHMPQGCA